MNSLYETLLSYFHLDSLTLLARENAGKRIEDILSITDNADLTACNSTNEDFVKAVEFLKSEVMEGKQTVVYGDYDVDGLTSVSIVYLTLKALGLKDKSGFYIPSRYDTGYGLNKNILEAMVKKGYAFLIATDNGITKRSECEYLRENGLDYLILDHHEEQKGTKPYLDDGHLLYHRNDCSAAYLALVVCYAVLNDRPFLKALIGKGMAVSSPKEIEALKIYFQILASLAVFSDCMPLTDIHDLALAKRGLKLLNSVLAGTMYCPYAKRMTYLVDDYKPGKELSYEDINFQINSKLNAVARVWGGNKTNIGAFFLTTNDEKKAFDYSQTIIKANEEKKNYVRAARSKTPSLENDTLYVVDYTEGEDSVPSGLSGLIANSTLNQMETKRTVLVLCPSTIDKRDAIGSLRGPEGLSLDKVLESPTVKMFLKDHGGHEAACGLTLPLACKEDFISELNALISSKAVSVKTPGLEIPEEWVNELDYDAFESLEPYGHGFKAPDFVLTINRNRLVKGIHNNHIFVPLSRGGKLVIFNGRDKLQKISDSEIRIRGSLKVNEFRGKRTIEFFGDFEKD